MIDEKTFRTLIESGMNFADIGRLHGVSRERARQISAQYGITEHPCNGGCGDSIPMKLLLCEKCSAERKLKRRQHKDRVRNPRTYESRPIVSDAKELFEKLGLTVEIDPYAPRAGAELVVNGVRVKCQQMVQARVGHQVRLNQEGDDLPIDYYFLSDTKEHGIVPRNAIKRQTTYIGLYSPLREYFTTKWWDKWVEELKS